ncbi:MAG: class I SAM-dependent methyltransferase [Coriobacteriia bacterium]|nr:class I SAM-dependent methyltransferase [Coriobacteriia bacterium]
MRKGRKPRGGSTRTRIPAAGAVASRSSLLLVSAGRIPATVPPVPDWNGVLEGSIVRRCAAPARRTRTRLSDPTRGTNAEATAPAAANGASVPTGNVYDKYGTRNPVSRLLMSGFRRSLDAACEAAGPESQLDVGCGEGVLAHHWALCAPERRIVAVDLEDDALQATWAQRTAPNLRFGCASVTALPFDDGEFDLVSGIEVLEHVPEPDAALAEMFRVAGRNVLVSVPREPLWRAMNLARGAYVGEAGNTPGHVNHWSRRGFLRLVSSFGEVEAVFAPTPWTIALLRARRSGRA